MKSLIAAVLVLVPVFSFAQKYNVDEKTSWTFESLVKTIGDGRIQSVEALLPKLPAEFKSNYVLMYKSRSLQGGSFANPRAILFGNDATLLMTFNGDSTQAGYNTVEVIQFRAATARFEFREIQFRQDGPAAVSEANPAKCVKCHQSP